MRFNWVPSSQQGTQNDHSWLIVGESEVLHPDSLLFEQLARASFDFEPVLFPVQHQFTEQIGQFFWSIHLTSWQLICETLGYFLNHSVGPILCHVNLCCFHCRVEVGYAVSESILNVETFKEFQILPFHPKIFLRLLARLSWEVS